MLVHRPLIDELRSRLSEFQPFIQIIVGPRQVGKSTAAKQLANEQPGKAIYVAFDNPGPTPEQEIRFHWQEARLREGHTILIFDEIQDIKGWSRIIKELYDEDRDKRKLSIALLGSSALELALKGEESLLGRFEVIRTYHWNANEMNEGFGWDLDAFLKFGGYPAIGELLKDNKDATLARCQSFVKDSIIEPVISRDVLSLGNVMNSALFRQTLHIALTSPCQEVSLTKILGQMSDRGNVTTIKGYLELLEKTFLIKLLYRFSGTHIRQRASSPKIIPLAPALLHAFIDPKRAGRDPDWYGLVFEAAIASRFLAMGYELFYWSNSRDDVDLVIKKNEKILAIEVKSNQTPDWRGLKAFQKQYPSASIALINHELGRKFLTEKDASPMVEGWFTSRG